LANVLLQAENNALQITATDMEVGIRSQTPATVRQSGSVTVSARKLFDILRTLDPESEVQIETSGAYLVIRSGLFKTSLASLPADDFPELHEDAATASIQLSGQQLAEMIAATSFAMSTDETRKYLTGTLFELGDGHMRLVTTDGHRLALSEIQLAADASSCQCIVPRKAVTEIRKLCEGMEEQVQLVFGERQIRLHAGHDLLVSKLIDARFPVYQDVIPKGNPNTALLRCQLFDQALSRSMIIANDITHDLRLAFSTQTLDISAHNTEHEEVEEQVPLEFNGQDVAIGFNGRYLRDALGVIRSETVCMEVKDELSPVLLYGEGVESTRYVIMPMRI
jgi:DNA polymerase-3 subunit beta